MLDIKVKEFGEITTLELYEVLQLRTEIFVVEQDCVYQDLDGKDDKAIHVIGYNNNKIVAYTRIFKPGYYFNESSIGRVAVHKEYRNYGYGKDIMQASINAVKEKFNEDDIKISAQVYLTKFYTELGFRTIGEGYLEDGIPHIAMIKN
ncbi:GNAT family N-acetyltransferase [Maribacter hydrothermalis]|uniref:GNAT family acetyltransferase n=1 Tax=Maribacter hydrothermalis TaxID=1836467 RepID=A0A1B7Z4E3_9FLAO|nr:GNAT family N-acetyltransferase [Maribacter hydrothermalis]APQ17313.1 GNAT family N-acetyltransferase [Maribacter hydrothermalis]OBR37573.1 GNAT family acetyltransferase [Maribacter hydrothermalis]